MKINMDDVAHLIELRGVYDGWSIAVMKDGRALNRWDKKEYPKRWAATQEFLERDKDASNP